MLQKFLPLIVVVVIDIIVVLVTHTILHIRDLKKAHKEALSIAKHNSFNKGWNEALFHIPVVQHCNSRTKYEFIKHKYDPQACPHCKEIEGLMNEF